MANQSGKPVLDVVKSDIGLAFIAYPEIVCKLPYSALLATLFFARLILLALGSNLSDRDYKERTPLQLAAEYGNYLMKF